MRLVNCLSPKVITNPYTGERRQVPCGRCEACLNARSANWVQRLDQEMMCHKYTFFVTLQYDEQNVCQLVRMRPEDCQPNDYSYIDSETGAIYNLSDVSGLTQKDFDYCKQTKVLIVLNFKDVSNFIKRLRYSIKKGFGECLSFRYYITGEYGETTFRSHFHCLFFFDSPWLSQNFNRCLVESWRNGCVYDPHPVVDGSSSKYVASYVNSFACLPAIYRHKELRQRSVFSKYPPIGTLDFTATKVRQFVSSDDCTVTLYDRLRNEFCDVPLSRSLQNRFFPKLQRYNVLSDSDRITLYRTALDPWCSAVENARTLERRYITDSSSKCFLALYLRAITTLPLRGNNKFVKRLKFSRYNFDSLVRFVRVVSSVQKAAALCGLSVDVYVKRLIRYYDKNQMSRLKQWYQVQDEYFKTHSVSDYLLFDANYWNALVKAKSLNKYQLLYLETYGIDPFTLSSLDVDSTAAYRELFSLHKKIFYDNTKTKRQNDYLLQHKEKFGNIINYLELK